MQVSIIIFDQLINSSNDFIRLPSHPFPSLILLLLLFSQIELLSQDACARSTYLYVGNLGDFGVDSFKRSRENQSDQIRSNSIQFNSSISSTPPADNMIAEGVGDLPHAVDAPPEGVPSPAAPAARPTAAQLVEPAAAGGTVLRQQAATRRARVHVVVVVLVLVLIWRVREGLAGFLEKVRRIFLLLMVLLSSLSCSSCFYSRG